MQNTNECFQENILCVPPRKILIVLHKENLLANKLENFQSPIIPEPIIPEEITHRDLFSVLRNYSLLYAQFIL